MVPQDGIQGFKVRAETPEEALRELCMMLARARKRRTTQESDQEFRHQWRERAATELDNLWQNLQNSPGENSDRGCSI